MKNSLLPISKLHVLVLSLLFGLFACQEEQISEEVNEWIPSNLETFTFTYDGQKYVERLEFLPSSKLDIPLPKTEVLLKAMQQPNAAVFVDHKNKSVSIFDTVDEAKKAFGIFSDGNSSLGNEPINQRPFEGGLVTIYEKPGFDCSVQGTCIGIGVGEFMIRYKHRLPDLSNLSFNGEPVNMDRKISSIRLANLSETRWMVALCYDQKYYQGRAIILQSPPDPSPNNNTSSNRYFDLPGNSFDLWIKNGPYNECEGTGRVAGKSPVGGNWGPADWNNRIRSIETFHTIYESQNWGACTTF